MKPFPTRRPLTVDEIENTDWTPQAILRAKVADFCVEGMARHAGTDDLDSYEGAFGTVQGVRVGLMRHRGNPDGVLHLCMEPFVTDVELVTAVVAAVMRDFGTDPDALVWQRRDGSDDHTFEVIRGRVERAARP